MNSLVSTPRKVAAVVVLAGLVLAPQLVTAEDPSRECEGKVYVVKIHADWCGSCQATESVWERVRKEIGDRATVVKLDVSDRVEYNQSMTEARRLGIESFFQEYRSRTGVVAILDCRTREPVEILNGERDFEKYLQAVDKAGRTS